MTTHESQAWQTVGKVGLIAGPIAAALAYFLLPAEVASDAGEIVGGLSPAARGAAAVGVLMAVWWLTEALPLPATALAPIALLPLLGAVDVKAAASPYASDLIYLFMGGFILGLGMERWGLHRRIALLTILLVGASPRRLIAGFMLATAVMSMWVSNTATAIMMLPIATSVIGLLESRLDEEHRGALASFAVCLLLAIAYSASIGGVGTIIGTPPNLVLAAFSEDELGIKIGMARWLMVGLPMVAIFLPLCWAYLVLIAYRFKLPADAAGRELIRDELRQLGTLKRGEWNVLVIFSVTATLWITRPWLEKLGEAQGWIVLSSLSDAGIAVLAALALFITPTHWGSRTMTMNWETARKLPWGVLLLFGGGLSLASAIKETGVDVFLGQQFGVLEGAPTLVIVLAVAAMVIFLTELTSNTAVTSALLPVLAAAAVGLGVDPLSLCVPAALAASFAFMLPVATPPNAVVFGSGRVSVRQMAGTGFRLNLVGIVLVTVVGYWLAMQVLV